MAGVTRRERSTIKSIQRGTTTSPSAASTTNVTITSVDTDKSTVNVTFSAYGGDSTGDDEGIFYCTLTTATNLQIVNSGTNSQSFPGSDLAWEVIEYE